MKRFVILIFLLAVASPVFADNILNVTGISTSSIYMNSKTPGPMLNLSLNVTPGGSFVNITAINVTFFTSTGAPLNLTNISSVDVRNASNGFIFGSNSTLNISTNNVTISFPNGIVVNGTQNNTITIFVNISSLATLALNFTVNITSNYSIYTTANDNFTIYGGSTQARASQSQDLHANASVSPRIVDTGVINQTFIITITPTGMDQIKNLTITLPSGYNITNVTSVKQSGTEVLYISSPTALAIFRANIAQVNRTGTNIFSSSGGIIINLTVNTNSSAITSSEFVTRMIGANLTNVAPDVVGNNTNVTTTALLTVVSTQVTKGAAVINGTDYWEFNITLNVTQTTTGVIQFKMSNWSGTGGLSMALTNQTDTSGALFYASIRNQSLVNSSSSFNITNEYNLTQGLQYTNAGPNNLITVVLRMVIPIGTTISNSWQSTFNTLFRATP